MKKLLALVLFLLGSLQAVMAVEGPPYNYYVWFPENIGTPAEIDFVKVWFFKNEGDYKKMMNQIEYAQGFKQGFSNGYGIINKYTKKYLPKAGAALELVSSESLAGLGTATNIAAKIHGYFGKALDLGIALTTKELKKEFKSTRIGYDGDLEPGQYYWKSAKDKDRNKVYLVITLGDPTRKKLEGLANKIDMYPLWQGYVEMSAGENKKYLQVRPFKQMIRNSQNGQQEPYYAAAVTETTESAFNVARPKLSDKD